MPPWKSVRSSPNATLSSSQGIDEVDRTLIRSWLDRDPWERVRMGLDRHASFMEMRRCLRVNSTR